MGYISSTKAINRVRPFLDDMVKSENTLVWSAENPSKLRMHLYNAMSLARKVNLPMYANLLDKFSIQANLDKRTVTAKRKEAVTSGAHTFPEVMDMISAIGILVMTETELPIDFPSIEVNEENSTIANDWAKANNYSMTSGSSAGYRFKKAETFS